MVLQLTKKVDRHLHKKTSNALSTQSPASIYHLFLKLAEKTNAWVEKSAVAIPMLRQIAGVKHMTDRPTDKH